MTLLPSEATVVDGISSTELHLIRIYLGHVRLRPVTRARTDRRELVPLGRGTGPVDPGSGVALSQSFPGPAEPPATPATVRSAVAFMDAHVLEPIGLPEVAGAVRLSPRALQAAFRKHLGTTPLGYLRASRMAGAHAELEAARPGDGRTVSTVANRWGFSQLSRFARDYKERYGVSPHTTLGRPAG